MTFDFEVKFKNISKFDIYKDSRLDINKIGDYYGRVTSEIKFVDDDTIRFSSGSFYFDDIFKALTIKYPDIILRYSCVNDEDFFNSPYAFYKNGAYIASIFLASNMLRVPSRFTHNYDGVLIDDKGNYYYDKEAMDFLVKYQDEVKTNDPIFYNTFQHEAILSKNKRIFNKVENYDILDIKCENDFDNIFTFDNHLILKEIAKEEFLLLFNDENKWLLNDLENAFKDNSNKKLEAYSAYLDDDYSKLDYDEIRKEYDLWREERLKEKTYKDVKKEVEIDNNDGDLDDVLPFD